MHRCTGTRAIDRSVGVTSSRRHHFLRHQQTKHFVADDQGPACLRPVLDNTSALLEFLRCVVQEVQMIRTSVVESGILDGTPTAEFSRPILDSVDRHNDQHCLRWGVTEENIDEGDHLDSFATTHRMREDAAETWTGLKSLKRLDNVVVHETNATDLVRLEDGTQMLAYVQIGLIRRMIDIDQHIA